MRELPQSKKLIVFTAVILAIMLFALDNMIITPAIPRILADIGGLTYLNWVFTAYLLTSTITTPIYGKLSDIFSRKLMLLLAITIFVVASMLCGISTNIIELSVFRAIQGIGGGAIMVTAMSMIGEIFTLEERPKYQGYIGMVFAIASIAGPVLGAFITASYSWRWTFYINLPVGIIAFLLIWLSLPSSLHQRKNHTIDYMGATLLSLSLIPLVLFFSSVTETKNVSFHSVLFLLFSLVAFILFYLVERRAPSPVFSHHLFYDRYFVVPAIMTFVSAIILFSSTIYIQIYAQKVMNLSIQDSGILLSSIVVPLTLSSPIYGHIFSRTKKYKGIVIFGAIILFLSMALLTRLLFGSPNHRMFVVHLIPLGIGLGAMMSIFNMIIQVIYPRERLGEITGALQLVRGIGGTFGTALLGYVFGYFVTDLNASPEHISLALRYIFMVITFFAFISLVSSFFIKEKKILL